LRLAKATLRGACPSSPVNLGLADRGIAKIRQHAPPKPRQPESVPGTPTAQKNGCTWKRDQFAPQKIETCCSHGRFSDILIGIHKADFKKK